MTDVLAAGDTLVISDLDRLSRRAARIILTLDELASRKITVESIYERVDTSTADELFSVTILGALAQRERDRIAECTRAGLEAARACGRHPGRPVAVTPEQHETVFMLRGLRKSYRQVAAATGLSASTIARVCRTIDVTTDYGNTERIRLLGINTPEVEHKDEAALCGGEAAADRLAELLPEGTAVQLAADSRADAKDRYGQLLRYVETDAGDAGATLVSEGYAYTWTPASAPAPDRLADYETATVAARAAGARADAGCPPSGT